MCCPCFVKYIDDDKADAYLGALIQLEEGKVPSLYKHNHELSTGDGMGLRGEGRGYWGGVDDLPADLTFDTTNRNSRSDPKTPAKSSSSSSSSSSLPPPLKEAETGEGKSSLFSPLGLFSSSDPAPRAPLLVLTEQRLIVPDALELHIANIEPLLAVFCGNNQLQALALSHPPGSISVDCTKHSVTRYLASLSVSLSLYVSLSPYFSVYLCMCIYVYLCIYGHIY